MTHSTIFCHMWGIMHIWVKKKCVHIIPSFLEYSIYHCTKTYICIGLFKMFLRWILRIFNAQIQSERGTNQCNLCFKIKTKTYLVFISMGCDPFYVSLVTDRHLKVRCNTDFVYIFRRRRFYLCQWLVAPGIERKKLGHNILRYVSEFWCCERDNYFFIGKTPSRKHFKMNNT